MQGFYQDHQDSLCGSLRSRNNNARHVGVDRTGTVNLDWYNWGDRLTLFVIGLHLTSDPNHVDNLGSFEWPCFTRFDDPLEAGLFELPSFGDITVLMTTVFGYLLSILMRRVTSGGRYLGHLDNGIKRLWLRRC